MNKSNFYHAVYALLAQAAVWLLTGDLLSGAMVGTAFFFGREMTQYQTRLAASGTHITMQNPLLLFCFWRWGSDSVLDVASPALVTFSIWAIANGA